MEKTGEPTEPLSKDHSSTLYLGGHPKAGENPMEQRVNTQASDPHYDTGNRASLTPLLPSETVQV